ncbi:MAG TPA: kelch repeat-containing protein, partial [Ignavibacteriales bacterium]|nr:kelch repeat-containing protein [Ignavibacteriales bacterium]
LQGLKWQTETALPQLLNNGGAAVYIKSSGDKNRPDTPYVVHMGGRYFNARTDNIWKYNTLTKQWAESDTSLPVPLYDFSPIQVEDKIYITGGWMPGGVSSAMYIYDPEMDTIGRGADIPIITVGFVIGSYADSLIYVMGGGTNIPKVQIYNIKSNSWKEGTPYPKGALFAYGGICGSKIVLPGKSPLYDFYLDSASATYIGEINPNDPYTISWKKGKDYPSQAYYGISAGAWQGRQRKFVCLIGGCYASNSISNDVWIYDVEKDNWYAAPNQLVPTTNSSNLVFVVRNDSLFMAALGGYNNSEGFLDKNEWLYIGRPSDLDSSDIGTAEEPNSPVPVLYSLSQNYPNPFNPSTTIKYSIAEAGKVELKIYNMLGQEITTLVNEMKNAGQYEVKFNAAGINLSSGVYIYRIKSGSFVQTKKLMLIK